MTKILGLDVSTYTGMALLNTESGQARCKLLNSPTMKGLVRVQSIARGVRDFIQEHQPDLAVIEEFAYGNRFTLVTLCELQTAIKLEMLECHLPWYQVSPTTLKKWTTGKGNANKDLMAKEICRRWDYTSASDDLIDAYALARMGAIFIDPNEQKKGLFTHYQGSFA